MSINDNDRAQKALVPQGKYLDQPVKYQYYDVDSYVSEADNNDEIDLRDYLRRVQRHKWLVAFITVVLTFLAALYLHRQPKIYQADARIQVDSEEAATVEPERGGSISPYEDRAYFNTQLETLDSPEMIRRVIRKLDLENNPQFMSVVKKDGVEKQAGLLSIAGRESPKTPDKSKDTQNSQRLAEAQRLEPYVEEVRDSLNVLPVLQTRQTVKDTRLISVKYKHADPKIAADVVNTLIQELVDSNLAKKAGTNSNENEYLKDNIADLKTQIRHDEEKLLAYGRNYELPTQDEKQNTVTERLLGLNRQLLEAESGRKQAEAAYNAAMAPGTADAVAINDSKPLADIEAKIDGLRQRRAQLLVDVTEKYPEVKEIDQQLAVLEKSAVDKRQKATSGFKTNLEMKYKEAVARENAIRTSYQEQWQKTMNQNGAAINYRIIQQNLETNRKLLDDMQQREKRNEMKKAKIPNNISIVEHALIPTEPMDPKNMQYLGLAFLLSLSFGIGGALIRDYFDDSVRTREEVEKALSLPALAVIPEVSNGLFSSRRKLSVNPLHLAGETDEDNDVTTGNELIISGNMRSPMVEAVRHLRTVLLFSPEVGEIRTLLITSSVQGEGKTTTSVNIATSLSQTGASVLLIDADLRSPRLHKIFNLENLRGLSDLLLSEDDNVDIWDHVVHKTKKLNILPSGPLLDDCAEHLGSNRMKNLLASFEGLFDYVVIDSPPVTAFADGAVLASLVDGVLMVVQGNRSAGGMLKHSQKLLNMVGANIVGVVLNKVKHSTETYYAA